MGLGSITILGASTSVEPSLNTALYVPLKTFTGEIKFRRTGSERIREETPWKLSIKKQTPMTSPTNPWNKPRTKEECLIGTKKVRYTCGRHKKANSKKNLAVRSSAASAVSVASALRIISELIMVPY